MNQMMGMMGDIMACCKGKVACKGGFGADNYGKDNYGKDLYGKGGYGKAGYGKDSYSADSYGADSYGNNGGCGSVETEFVCALHNKVRAQNCLVAAGDGTYYCKPGRECQGGFTGEMPGRPV